MRGDIATGEATLPRRSAAKGEADLAFALASDPKKVRASSDHRPPTSAATTTSLALPPSPDISGYVRSFRRLASVRATPSYGSAPGRAVPSRVRADTRVVSMASCAPPCKGSPSATTSCLRLSMRCGGHRSKSRTITFVRTRAPASRHTRAAALSSGNPLLPRTLPLRKLHGGGQGCREDGHTGSCEWTEEGKVDTSEQQNAERLGVKSRCLGGQERHERGRQERARLGPQQRSLLHWEGGHQHFSRKSSCNSLLRASANRNEVVSGLHLRWHVSQVANLQPTLPERVETGQTERCFTDRHAFNVVRWVVRDACSPCEHNQPNCSSELRASPTRRCATPILPLRGAMGRSAVK